MRGRRISIQTIFPSFFRMKTVAFTAEREIEFLMFRALVRQKSVNRICRGIRTFFSETSSAGLRMMGCEAKRAEFSPCFQGKLLVPCLTVPAIGDRIDVGIP